MSYTVLIYNTSRHVGTITANTPREAWKMASRWLRIAAVIAPLYPDYCMPRTEWYVIVGRRSGVNGYGPFFQRANFTVGGYRAIGENGNCLQFQ